MIVVSLCPVSLLFLFFFFLFFLLLGNALAGTSGIMLITPLDSVYIFTYFNTSNIYFTTVSDVFYMLRLGPLLSD